MAEMKTKVNEASVEDFLSKVENEQKRKDSFEIVKIMQQVTKEEPKMWGPAIIGFGSYHYKYESGREGDMPQIAFSPRKQNITLYTQGGHKLRFFKGGKAQFVTVGIIYWGRRQLCQPTSEETW